MIEDLHKAFIWALQQERLNDRWLQLRSLPREAEGCYAAQLLKACRCRHVCAGAAGHA